MAPGGILARLELMGTVPFLCKDVIHPTEVGLERSSLPLPCRALVACHGSSFTRDGSNKSIIPLGQKGLSTLPHKWVCNNQCKHTSCEVVGDVGFIFGLLAITLIITVFMTVSVFGLGIWASTRAFKAVRRKLFGEPSTPERTQTPVNPEPTAHYEVPRPEPRTQSRAQSRTQAQDQEYQDVRAYVHQDVDAGATSESITKVLQAYASDPVVGTYASDAIDQLKAADRRERSLLGEIDNEFEPHTISWDRFVSTANAAFDAILRNSAHLANRIQAFDVEDYQRMEEFYRTGGFSTHGVPESARLERWKLLDETKREMDELRATNDNLLLELGKLASEVRKLSSTESHDESARIAEEVSKLVEETKYYR